MAIDIEKDVTYTEENNLLIYEAKDIGFAMVYNDKKESAYYVSDTHLAQFINMDEEEFIEEKKKRNAFKYKDQSDSLIFPTRADLDKFVDEIFMPKLMAKIVS